MFATLGQDEVQEQRVPLLSPQQAGDLAESVLKKTVIGSIVVFGLIYWFLIK